MPIDAVVFDIGRVLIDWQPEAFYDRTIGADRRAALFSEVDLHGMNRTVDLGVDIETAVEGLAAQHPGWAAEIRLWNSHWLEMASPEISGTPDLLKAVKATGIPVFALTNFGTATFARATEAYPFFALFDRSYVSAHLNLMKPDPAIYEVVERDSGIAPDRLIFTDDSLPNIEAAAARGWKTHHFTGAAGWAARLIAEGILSEDEVQALA